MAKKSTAAQHFLECDNCEERPAEFLCKTCTGHLCESCKTEHEKKKMTRSHEIVYLISNNENMVDLLYCTEHTKKKLECYCDRCKEPVCTDCIIQSHNGHSVDSLSTVYKRITDGAKQQKEKIDYIFLPKYRELVSKETAKELALKRRAEEIKKTIDAHTESLVEMIKTIGTQTVEDLSNKEEDGLWEIEQTKNNLKKKIYELQLMSTTISANIEAKPGISFFKLVERNDLERFEKTLPNTDYSLTDFQPGDIKLAIQDNYGIQSILQRSVNKSSTDKEVEVNPARTKWTFTLPERKDRSRVRQKGFQGISRDSEWDRKMREEREELRQKQLQQEGYQGILKEREELRQKQLQQEGYQGILKDSEWDRKMREDSEWDRKMREEREELRQIQLQQEGLQGMRKEEEELQQKHLQQEEYLGILEERVELRQKQLQQEGYQGILKDSEWDRKMREERKEIQLQHKVLNGILEDRIENQSRILKAQEQLQRKLKEVETIREQQEQVILKQIEQLRKEKHEKISKYTIRKQRP